MCKKMAEMKNIFSIWMWGFVLLNFLSWGCSRDISVRSELHEDGGVSPYGISPIPDIGYTEFCKNEVDLPRDMILHGSHADCGVTPGGTNVCLCSCPKFVGCVDGKVYAGGYLTMESSANEECFCNVHLETTCKKGCRKDCKKLNPYTKWEDYCEENRPKRPGDPCNDDKDCTPSTFHVDVSKLLLLQGYLRCDASLKKCVNTPPPPKKDFMASCGVQLSYEGYRKIPSPYAPALGLVAAPKCESQTCFLFGDEQQQCVFQGCTSLCQSDRQCPQGSRCLDVINEIDLQKITMKNSNKKACLPALNLHQTFATPRTLKLLMQCLP